MPELRKGGTGLRVAVARDAPVFDERLTAPRALPFPHVPTRVHDEPVEPGRKLGLAAELAEPDAELGESLLRRVPRVFRVGEEMGGEPLDTSRVPLAQGGERLRVAVLCTLDQDRIAQPLVDERPLEPQWLLDLTARAPGGLHGGH